MIPIRMQVVVNTPARKVWEEAGKFDALADWHPAIKRCDLSDDGKVRTVHTPDGSTSDERLLSRDDEKMRYTYEAVDPGGPAKAFRGKFAVDALGDKASVVWEGELELAPGFPEDKAKEIFGGIFHAGAQGLKQRFGG